MQQKYNIIEIEELAVHLEMEKEVNCTSKI